MSKIKKTVLRNKDEIPSYLPDQPYWNIKHYTFLEHYRETLDESLAAKAAGLDSKSLKKAMEDPKIRHAMEDAKNDFIEALKLTPKKGAAKFLSVYEKIEQRFETDSKVAGALANMAATFLKATGQLNKDDGRLTPKVSININTKVKDTKVIASNNVIDIDLSEKDYDDE
jgi:hypothetical protein